MQCGYGVCQGAGEAPNSIEMSKAKVMFNRNVKEMQGQGYDQVSHHDCTAFVAGDFRE